MDNLGVDTNISDLRPVVDATTVINTSGSTLTDTFTYYKSKLNVRVELHRECVKFFNIQTNNKNQNINSIASLILNWSDVGGSRVGKGHTKNDKNSYLTIYAYVPNTSIENPSKPSVAKIKQRKRLALELAFSKYASFEENLAHVNNWHNQLDTLNKTFLYEKLVKCQQSTSSSSDLSIVLRLSLFSHKIIYAILRRLYVILFKSRIFGH